MNWFSRKAGLHHVEHWWWKINVITLNIPSSPRCMHWVWLTWWGTPLGSAGVSCPHCVTSCAPPASSPVGQCGRQEIPWCPAVGKQCSVIKALLLTQPKYSTIRTSVKKTLSTTNKTSPSLFFSGSASLPILLSPPPREAQGHGEWGLQPVQCALSMMLLPPHAVPLLQCGVPPMNLFSVDIPKPNMPPKYIKMHKQYISKAAGGHQKMQQVLWDLFVCLQPLPVCNCNANCWIMINLVLENSLQYNIYSLFFHVQ